jgi:MscS family membrane protein
MNCISKLKRQYILQEKKNNVKFDVNKFDTVEKVSKVTFFLIWFFLMISHFGIDLNALLAFGGIGGIVFGFASKDLFLNVFGGVTLY